MAGWGEEVQEEFQQRFTAIMFSRWHNPSVAAAFFFFFFFPSATCTSTAQTPRISVNAPVFASVLLFLAPSRYRLFTVSPK